MQTRLAVTLWRERTTDERRVRIALRAALDAAHLLGLAVGTHLRRLRAHADPLPRLQARLDEAELRARLAHRASELLAARLGKIPDTRRPHYSPEQRFAILEIKSLLAWSAHDTARQFLVCPNTILNWERVANPESRTAGSTVEPAPPVRRAAGVVRSTVQLLSRLGCGGQEHLARVLARAGWRLSARSVGRYRKERPAPDTPPAAMAEPRRRVPVVARFAHHVWMMDVSRVKQLLGPDLYVAAVFDAFSRVPLAVQVFGAVPGARAMAKLLSLAVRRFTAPRHVITDLGTEFTGRAFRRTAARLGAVHRFAAKDSILATARIERFWRTLKELARLRRLQLPMTAGDLENRLEVALLYYVAFRPHAGLGGATPFEALAGAEPAHLDAVEPPRGLAGAPSGAPPFQVVFLDPAHRRFPVLSTAA